MLMLTRGGAAAHARPSGPTAGAHYVVTSVGALGATPGRRGYQGAQGVLVRWVQRHNGDGTATRRADAAAEAQHP
ncbi:hypothetical protein [Nocardia camponoti]|uniref:hypothetical protein n=1 Tax=Nocardia camponoti TaxID=1616106 RepID=UPI0016682D45|nr:hypothetical protein [Nocardia camponoti]